MNTMTEGTQDIASRHAAAERRDDDRASLPPISRRLPLGAVVFDRDGTLVEDVPYNADPVMVRPLPGARAALDLLRERDIRVAVATNQSGVARGIISQDRLTAVHRRVEALLGPFDAWAVCPHRPEDHCRCRKPAPGMLLDLAIRLRMQPRHMAYVGDIGSDMTAAAAAGMRSVMVPTAVTRRSEVAAAPTVATDLTEAVRALLEEAR